MKKIAYIFTIALAATLLPACSLDQEPGGSSITENQYQKMDDAAEGAVRGIYTLLYAHGGEHDAFSQRSIDMYGDLLCGDMGMNTQNYGWFVLDERMQTYTRRAYFWSYYYDIIRLCNKTINALDAQGRPELEVDITTLSTEEIKRGMYFGEVLAMRGWAYASLLRYFSNPPAEMDLDLEAVPVYTENDTKGDTIKGAPRSTVGDVYLRVEEDLLTAIDYLDEYQNKKVYRTNKIEMNADAARITLAYAYLNKNDYANALKYAEEAIAKTTANLLPVSEVLTTGFNDISNNNWIWGEDVTVDNTTALASFFGQCDIYSYSYASAGDVKGIDANLLKEIQDLTWDIREGWWCNYANSGERGASAFNYAPDGKFYSATSKELQADRDWLSDNVYMRLELAYLIAAEAACRSNDLDKAQQYLFAITDRRVKPDAEGETTNTDAYDAWKTATTSTDALLAAIRYNWRVELWGEGYGLQTFRRYGQTVALGDNHLRSNKSITPSGREFTFEIPTSEQYYNPYIRNTTELTQKQAR